MDLGAEQAGQRFTPSPPIAPNPMFICRAAFWVKPCGLCEPCGRYGSSAFGRSPGLAGVDAGIVGQVGSDLRGGKRSVLQ